MEGGFEMLIGGSRGTGDTVVVDVDDAAATAWSVEMSWEGSFWSF